MIRKRRRKIKPRKRNVAEKEGDACAERHLLSPEALASTQQNNSTSIPAPVEPIADRLLKAAYRFLTLANNLTNESDTLDRFVDEIKAVSLCEAVGIKMDGGDGLLVYGAHDGFCEGFMETEGRLSLSEEPCFCARVLYANVRRPPFFTSGGSFVVNDAADPQTQDELRRSGPHRGTCFRFGYRSMGLFPVCSRGQMLGVIQVADPQPNRLPLEVARLMEKVALLLGTSLEKARAQRELQGAHQDLEAKISRRTSELKAANQALRKEVGQRRDAEDRMKQSERMLHSVFNGISDPLVLINRKMEVKITNEAARAYYSIDDALQSTGKPCYEGLGLFREPCQTCPVPGAVKAGRHFEFERHGFVDEGRNESVVVYPLKDSKGRPQGAVMRIQDITETKMVNRQLEQIKNQASLGMLVSSVAHEIRNPNSFIAFNTSVLREYLNDVLPILDHHAESRENLEIGNMPYDEFRDDVLKLVDTIEHGSHRIDAFLSNLSAYRSVQKDIKRQWVSLSSIIDNIMNMAGTKIRQSVNAFEIEMAQDLPDIYSDEVVLEQVLVNLLVNAAQAADKGDSWIRLKVLPFRHDHDYIVIMVEDNGCGMDEQTQRQIFEPFYSSKVLEGGTGLGLYVCRNLVHELGGTLNVTSELGKGSSFSLELPIQDPDDPVDKT